MSDVDKLRVILAVVTSMIVGMLLVLFVMLVNPTWFEREPDLVLTIEGVEISCFRDVVDK